MQTSQLITPDGILLTHRLFTSCPTGAQFPARAIYCTHSQAQHSLNLAATLAGFARRGWTAHCTDLRGHGHSTGPRAPLAHMQVGIGWDRLVSDLTLGMQTAFANVKWEDRMVVAPNIGAPLVLEILKSWPDLARQIVFVAPPPNQPVQLKLARAVVRARLAIHPEDRPDELILHQLYTFLGARLSSRKELIDTVSSDPVITDALLNDTYAWPTPTTGYFHEMFRGIESGWRWPSRARVAPGTRMLVLYGGDDAVTANGRFVAPMRGLFERMGFCSVDTHCVKAGRAGLIIEEDRLGISGRITRWAEGAPLEPPEDDAAADPNDVGARTVLARLGLPDDPPTLDVDEMVELCYSATEDESRWVELLYRLADAFSGRGDDALDTPGLEAMIDMLMPHWERSYELNRKIMQAAAVGAVMQNVIERFDIGMAIVTPALDIVYMNAAFGTTVTCLPGATGSDSADPIAVARCLRHLSGPDFIARCANTSQETLLMIGGVPVGFYFRPKALRQTALQRNGAAGVLILRNPVQDRSDEASDPRAEDDRSELLQLAYGLTAKEAAATLGLLEGLTPEAISQRAGVSINTTRTHLKRIYEKIGVNGQIELTTRLLSGPFGLIGKG